MSTSITLKGACHHSLTFKQHKRKFSLKYEQQREHKKEEFPSFLNWIQLQFICRLNTQAKSKAVL